MGLKEYIPAIKYGNLVDNPEINPALVQSATTSISSAQILALNSTPIQLVTTTIAGTAIIVESLVFEMTPGTTTYSAGGALMLGYNSSTTTGNLLAISIPTALVATTTTAVGYTYIASTATAAGVLPNTGISLGLIGTTAFATGNGTAKAILNYYIVTI